VFATSRPIIQLTIVAKDPLLIEGQAPLGVRDAHWRTSG